MGWHSWQDRVFKTLMRLLPAEFRGDYEREMAATFRAERRSADGAASLTRVWLGTIADVFRTAPAEHLDILRRDLTYSIRMLARRPVLTLTAVLTLALGVGANTAIFSVVNGVLFAPLDYRNADELVLVEEQPALGDPGMTGYPTYADLRNENLTIRSMSALSGWSATLTGDGRDAERVDGARVTWEYFRTVGLTPAIGRDFEQGEDRPAGPGVVIISDSLWRRRYGADPNVVGRQIAINQQTFTLAGVLPPNADDIITARKFPNTEIWTLLQYSEQMGPPACRGCRHIHVVARLKGGVTPAESETDLTRVFRSLAMRFPTDYDRPRPVVTPLRDYVLGPVKTPLYLLWGAVALLLLIACANVANLLLIRASEREEEIAVRLALGVSPARMLRQLLTEAVVLAVIGGAAGTAVAFWATALLTTNGPAEIPRLSEVSPDARVLAYAFALSLVTGVLFGLAPARMLVAHPNVAGIGSRRTTSGPGAWRYRAALVAGNVALCVVLLVGAGLLVRSFARLLTVDTGFAPRQLLTFQINLIGQRYQQNAAITQFFDDLTARLRATPGVVNVSSSSMLPLTDSMAQMTVQIEGRPIENPAAAPRADTYAVRPDYFETTGIPLLRGRRFEYTDGERAAPVVIIGKTMAEELWPGEDPIGRRIRVPGAPVYPLRTIVGVVGDVKHFGLHLPVTPQAYVPHAQPPWPMRVMTVVVRTDAERDPLSLVPAVREHVRSIDPLQPVTRIQTFDHIVAQSMATRRFTLVLLASFAGTAVLLAIGGLYGALSYVVSQRSRDIGVRVALGASARAISGLVMRQGMTPAVVGLGVGLLASVAIGRVIESMLFGVSSRDLMTYATVITMIVAGALAACLFPARRAASLDAAVTLRAE
jgi:putative ABC transport system permease protein